jgi:hypothetical protein
MLSYTHAQAGKGNSNKINCGAIEYLPKLTTDAMLTSYDLMVRVCAVHILQHVWMTSFDSFANRYLLVLLHTHTQTGTPRQHDSVRYGVGYVSKQHIATRRHQMRGGVLTCSLTQGREGRALEWSKEPRGVDAQEWGGRFCKTYGKQ